jgi:hypothetical protein
MPPSGQGGDPPPGQPPYPQGWPAPAGPPPTRGRTGLTLALLGAGLVLVLIVIGVVAVVVRGEGDAEDSDGDAGGAREASCEVYADVVLSSEIWAATDFDPDKLEEMYDAALGDITDDTVEAAVEGEATVVVSYYRALGEWQQSVDDALARGEYPDTAIPAEITDQRGEIARTQGAVAEACQDVLPDRGDEPAPSVTAPSLSNPTSLDGE